MAARTIDYYDRRTSHGSTLSLITYAGGLAGLDPASSWRRFVEALESDLGDVQGGTTKEGIHMGVMSGTLDLLGGAARGQPVGPVGAGRAHGRRGPAPAELASRR